MKTKHTKDQRKRLFLLARLLDKVPKKLLDMGYWFTKDGHVTNLGSEFSPEIKALSARECGYAGCAIGWGLTHPAISKGAKDPHIFIASLGLPSMDDEPSAAYALFNSFRKVTPKRAAADIRRYLKDGTLPTK